MPEDGHASVTVRTQPAVTLDEAPGLVALVLGQLLDEGERLRMLQRQEGELVVTIESGENPRRERAEPSGAAVENDWAQLRRPLR